jgi:hypothetical protein
MGWRADLGRNWLELEVKVLNLVYSFEDLFEFELHSNSNHTHLTPNKIQKNPTHIFYHNLNLYFL